MAAKKTANKAAASTPKPAAKAPAKKAAKKTTVKAAAEAPAPAAKKKTAAKKAAAKSAPAPVAKSPARPPLDAIARAAYLNYRRRVEQGLPGDSHGDWLEAERQLTESV